MRRLLLTVALVALAGTVAACGGGNGVDPVAAAATKTASDGYRLTTSARLSVGGRALTMRGHGEFASDRGELEVDTSGLLGQLGGLAGLPAGADEKMETRYLTEDGDPVVYLSLGYFSRFLPGGKQWVRIDLEQAGKAAGLDLGRLMNGGAGASPGDLLALLRASGDFTEAGRETVGGNATTHYHGIVDLEQSLHAKGAPSDAIQRLLDLGAPSAYPIDVWVDDAGHVRRYRTTYGQTSGGTTVAVTTTTTFSDFGTTVDVAAPPADQVFDATELAKNGISSAGGGSTH